MRGWDAVLSMPRAGRVCLDPVAMFITNGYIFNFPGEYLKPALVVSLLSVWVLVGLFFYLNAYTKRRYFAIWNAAWLFYALWLTLSLVLGEDGANPWQLMLKHCSVGISAMFLLWGAAAFLEQPTSERVFGLFMGFLLVWSYLGAFHGSGLHWMQVGVFALMGLGSALTAYSFYKVRHRCLYLGAGLLSVGFLLWAGYLGCYPIWESSAPMIASGFFISAILQLFIAVSMIILVLEEARTTNQLALCEIASQKTESDDLRTKIQSTEERYRTLFAQASEAIIIASADDLHLLEMNEAACRLLRFSAVESPPQRLSSFIRLQPSADGSHPATGPEWYAALTKQPRLELIRSDGTVLPAEVAGAPLEFDGKPAYQFFFHEITERTRLEQQLRQAEKLSALGQMISGIAHELNNPLAVIKGYLDLVLSRHDLAPQTRADLEKVVHESNRAAKLVSNFLSFARERAARHEAVDLNRMVQRVMELREMDLRILGVQRELNLDGTIPKTEADASQLEQVLVNLVGNALHALAEWPGNRRLKISTRLRGDIILIQVEDSGPGVAPDALPHIFEPFFTTKPVGCGTGLGLSIAHSIIAEHHGRIYCQTPPGGGAAFIIELPIVEAQVTGTEEGTLPLPETAPLVNPANQPRAHILVLDDEPVLAELLAELLTTLGHTTVTSGSALQALELVQEQSFDLILSDFRMPLMNGREFYERLSQEQPSLAKRIVFVTGDVVNQETRAFLDEVGNPHLSKPFRLDEVAAAVTQVLQGEPALA